MLKFILATLFISGLGHAKIIKDDIYLKDQKEYDLKQVCNFFYKQDYPIIEIKSATRLDCMKGIVDVGTFCKKQQSDDPFLARGFISRKKKKVICQSARRVIIKYSCAKDGTQKCLDSSIGCYIFREKLAMRLKTAHHAFLDSGKGHKILSCYFQAENLLDLAN